MISEIKITGFKSLDEFELHLQPGLNVLVGPNGSGKSNILSLFEFISYISRYNLAEAVSRSGGAGTIFTRKISQEIANSISIDFSGHGQILPQRRQNRAQGKQVPYYVEYRYQAHVNLSEKGTKLLYGDQRVSFSVFLDPSQRSVRNLSTGDKRWHVDIITQVESGKKLLRRNKINKPALKRVLGSGFQPIDSFYLNYIQDVSSHPLYVALQNYLPPTRKILEDVSSGYIYNLNPSSIKQAEDIARPAEISADGSGLAATLFSIQERENQGPRLYSFIEHEGPKDTRVTIQQLREMFCLINDNITDIRVENDALENKLIVVATVNSKDGKVEIPLAMLSDGTVKWFSLVTAVLGQKAIFSLEEPENFLHPYVQKEIVEILRSSTQMNYERFSLMTTHSESLLNSLDPNEVVVVSMREGKTYAYRSPYLEEIRQEINSSGFGLGHFYVSGAVG